MKAMRILSRLASLRNTLFRKAALDRELDEEIRAAEETLVDRHLAGGMSPHAARRAAVAALGGPGGSIRVKEEVREGRVGAGLDSLLLDLRYAWRGLWTTLRPDRRHDRHARARHRRERRDLQRRARDAARTAAVSGRRSARVRLARSDRDRIPARAALRPGSAEPARRQHDLRRVRRHLGDRHGRAVRATAIRSSSARRS